MATTSRDKQKAKHPPRPAPSLAKQKGLAQIDDLLSVAGTNESRDQTRQKAGANAGKPQIKPAVAPKQAKATEVIASPPPAAVSRFARSLERADKGEPGPIRLADLSLDTAAEKAAVATGRVQMYSKILAANPSAQPGRPLVNVVGTSDKDLKFQLLSLYDLVLAARELGRETLQVSLVRLSPAEATSLLNHPEPAAPLPKALNPQELAAVNGFLSLPLAAIGRGENLRQAIDTDAREFSHLVESIREIGLQNPPVIEVRPGPTPDTPQFVCVSGHRRLLALEALGLTEATCALKVFRSERHRALASLAENINREDLHFLDKADGYGLLLRQGMAAGEIAAMLEVDARTVGKYLRAADWEPAVKARIRSLGPRMTTRFLLNMLAATERSTAELNSIIDRFVAGATAKNAKPQRGAALRSKLQEFYAIGDLGPEQRQVVEKALRFLGFLR